ncbi:hypothetical protein KBD34_01550 [Patescibacteria group bacterium]|nr:hypothetical protein [Patescibacteria group bacterium]
MSNIVRLVLAGFAVLCLNFATQATVEAQPRRTQRVAAQAVQHQPEQRLRRPRISRPPRYLNRLRGAGHRAYASVGEDYLSTIATVYNRMLGAGQVNLWRQHITRCTQYHADFIRVAHFFQVPTAFVAGIALHESHCVANAEDWAGGRGIGQLTFTSRAAHVRPVERVLGRPLRYRTTMRPGRTIPYDVYDHMLVAMMHWAAPERITRWCGNRRGCGILGYNMNPRTIARYARNLRRTREREQAPPPAGQPRPRIILTFAEIANTLPCITGTHGRCPREYVARVLAASLMYQRYMDNTAQTEVRDNVANPAQTDREALAGDKVPGFDPEYDRSFSTAILPRTPPRPSR